jgi:hypothetical protein
MTGVLKLILIYTMPEKIKIKILDYKPQSTVVNSIYPLVGLSFSHTHFTSYLQGTGLDRCSLTLQRQR